MLMPPYRRGGDIKLNGPFINRLVCKHGYAIANFERRQWPHLSVVSKALPSLGDYVRGSNWFQLFRTLCRAVWPFRHTSAGHNSRLISRIIQRQDL